MSYGFVYVLRNESMPGIYKIGFTMNHPKERMHQLSAATACPTPFELIAYIGCEYPKEVERKIHESLEDYRVNDAREFFKVPLEVIQHELRGHGEPGQDAFFDGPLDWLAIVEEGMNERQWLIDHFFEQCADPIFWPSKFRGFE